MQITSNGHSSFRIKTKNATIITDPYTNDSVGWKFPKTIAEIVTYSHNHPDHYNPEAIKNDDVFIVEGPGEYEVKEVMITGIPTFHDATQGSERGKNTVYLIEAEGLVVCHMGDLGHMLSDKQFKEVEDTDILMIPIGDFYTIGPEAAIKIIKQIEPSIVIPMHYKQPGMKESFASLKTLEDFLENFELQPRTEEKLSVTAGALPEEMELVVLSFTP